MVENIGSNYHNNTKETLHNFSHHIITLISSLTIFYYCSEELNGHWGEFDVDDVVYAAQHLIRARVSLAFLLFQNFFHSSFPISILMDKVFWCFLWFV